MAYAYSIYTCSLRFHLRKRMKSLTYYFRLFLVGRACLPHASAYSISKFGVEAFSDALRRELGPTGVQVSVVEPGFFQTNVTNPDILREQWQGLWNNLNHDLKHEYGENFYHTCK